MKKDKIKGLLVAAGMLFEVEIVDSKVSYGKMRYKVKPVAGKGEVWTEKVAFKK